MIKLITLVAGVTSVTAAFALPIIDFQEIDNGDGSTTYLLNITPATPTGEVSALDFTITGSLRQFQGGPVYNLIFSSPWKPNIVFTSDAALARAVDGGTYADFAGMDTVIDDTWWPGKILVDLVPDNGTKKDGTEMVRVSLKSFIGGIGGPLPGGPIPLAQVTVWEHDLSIQGSLISNSDVDGSFEWNVPISGDFDGDGDVDGNDLTDPTDGWDARYGVDLDGADFRTWQQNFGIGVSPFATAFAVPEPASRSLFMLAFCVISQERLRYHKKPSGSDIS